MWSESRAGSTSHAPTLTRFEKTRPPFYTTNIDLQPCCRAKETHISLLQPYAGENGGRRRERDCMGTHATIWGGGRVITSRHDGSEEGEGMIFVNITRRAGGQYDARADWKG